MVTPQRPCLELLPIHQPDGGSREVHDNFESIKQWATGKCNELDALQESVTALTALVTELEARIEALESA